MKSRFTFEGGDNFSNDILIAIVQGIIIRWTHQDFDEKKKWPNISNYIKLTKESCILLSLPNDVEPGNPISFQDINEMLSAEENEIRVILEKIGVFSMTLEEVKLVCNRRIDNKQQ